MNRIAGASFVPRISKPKGRKSPLTIIKIKLAHDCAVLLAIYENSSLKTSGKHSSIFKSLVSQGSDCFPEISESILYWAQKVGVICQSIRRYRKFSYSSLVSKVADASFAKLTTKMAEAFRAYFCSIFNSTKCHQNLRKSMFWISIVECSVPILRPTQVLKTFVLQFSRGLRFVSFPSAYLCGKYPALVTFPIAGKTRASNI